MFLIPRNPDISTILDNSTEISLIILKMVYYTMCNVAEELAVN